MKYLKIIVLLVCMGCHPEKKGEPDQSPLSGNWAFLDINGNYNEAFFTDSTYITYNMVYGLSPVFKYLIKNDSFYCNIGKQQPGLHRIGMIKIISPDSIIIETEFSRDTLGRLTGEKVTIENTDPKSDSVLFRKEIYRRYEQFLLAKGIIRPEEMEEFKKTSKIPEDLQKQH